MKHIGMVALMLELSVALVYAQQRPVTGSFSGTAAPSTTNLQAGTNTGEYRLSGTGALGQFTLRAFTASTSTPQPSGTCPNANQVHFSAVAGAGVFQLKDGSLLMVDRGQGDDCIDFSARVAQCTRTFQVSRGTGRFKDASGGTVTLTFTTLPVLFSAVGTPALSAITDGEVTGTIFGAVMEEEPHDERR